MDKAQGYEPWSPGSNPGGCVKNKNVFHSETIIICNLNQGENMIITKTKEFIHFQLDDKELYFYISTSLAGRFYVDLGKRDFFKILLECNKNILPEKISF